MPGFTPARAALILDANIVDGDEIEFSEDGTTASSVLANMPVTSWAVAVENASDATKSSDVELTSPTATGGGDISHGRVVATGGTPAKTKFRPLATTRTVTTGSTLTFASGEIDVILT